MSQVIIWHNGRFYNRVRQDEDEICEGCAGEDNEEMCEALAGRAEYTRRAVSAIRCAASSAEKGEFEHPYAAYRFEEIEVSDDKYRRATGA